MWISCFFESFRCLQYDLLEKLKETNWKKLQFRDWMCCKSLLIHYFLECLLKAVPYLHFLLTPVETCGCHYQVWFLVKRQYHIVSNYRDNMVVCSSMLSPCGGMLFFAFSFVSNHFRFITFQACGLMVAINHHSWMYTRSYKQTWVLCGVWIWSRLLVREWFVCKSTHIFMKNSWMNYGALEERNI